MTELRQDYAASTPSRLNVGRLWHGSFRSPNRRPRTAKTHFLIPATVGNVDLCKTLLTAGILGYPSPSILAWGEPYNEQGGLGGGSHLLKISRTLQYLDSLSSEQDDDLVLMIDAYDVHFQLPFEILLGRYHTIVEASNIRLMQDMGSAFHKEQNMRQRIIFGAGKRCAPNALWEVACYTVPDSPAPDDLYGNNTDTMLGVNQWFSCRQKYLNSGYIMGPVSAMRKLFRRAQERAELHKDRPIYGASDQAIFALIMGEQSYVREQQRLQHLSRQDLLRNPQLAQPRGISIQGGLLVDNILKPSITHTTFTPEIGVDYEFGITLDYLSELGHQTMNSDIDRDSQWVMWNDTRHIEDRVNERFVRHGDLDCPIRVPSDPPADLLATDAPHHLLQPAYRPALGQSWWEVPLYAHLCMGTVPVMIHHNGWKENREGRWANLWLQPKARELLMAQMLKKGPAFGVASWENFKTDPDVKLAGGAWTDKGNWIDWRDMCPDETYGAEIFRDM